MHTVFGSSLVLVCTGMSKCIENSLKLSWFEHGKITVSVLLRDP